MTVGSCEFESHPAHFKRGRFYVESSSFALISIMPLSASFRCVNFRFPILFCLSRLISLNGLKSIFSSMVYLFGVLFPKYTLCFRYHSFIIGSP